MKALGDFQTPAPLADAMTTALLGAGMKAARILEPTCGSGSFLRACAAAFPAAEILGVEYQRARYGAQLDAWCASQPRAQVIYANAYELDFATLPWHGSGPLLVIGNPPWITSAALGRSATGVQPPRSNLKLLRGLAARTGAANFDVAEFLILKLLRELRAEPFALALLVKESVARNVLAAADRLGLGAATAEIVRIDARKWFGVAVDACALTISTAVDGTVRTPVPIRPGFGRPPSGWFVPAAAAPATTIAFRQGIKHDAADVFELRWTEGCWRNGYGDTVDVEEAHVYPYLKARALHAGTLDLPMRLIVPQLRLGASTDELQRRAPRLWSYLCQHSRRIAARKSSIYRSAPPFALFGVGPYSFAPWKVAVAGLYARAQFRVVGPHAGRPVVFGDTAYFVPFEREADARAFGAVCTSSPLTALIAQRVNRGKRPITKGLLDALDWTTALAQVRA